MLLTKLKKAGYKNGTHKVSIESIGETFGFKTKITFNGPAGLIELTLPNDQNLIKAIQGIAYLSGIPEGQELKISSLIGLKTSVVVFNNQITKIK